MTAPQVDTNSAEYLAQLLKDKKQIAVFPNVFIHIERLLDEEIGRVRSKMFYLDTQKRPLELPEPIGPKVILSEKVFVPVKEHPDFNFVGRILGPRGMTARQLEQDTGCKIMVRGRGSMRDKKKEDQNRGKPNWEHLDEELHVLIAVEDTHNRAEVKLQQAVEEIEKLLVPAPEGEDDLKKRQLMELAIINGTYRDNSTKTAAALTAAACNPRIIASPMTLPQIFQGHLRSPTPGGAPIVVSPRLQVPTSMGIITNGHGAPPPLITPHDAAANAAAVSAAAAASGLLYTSPYDYPTYTTLTSPILEYPGAVDISGAGTLWKR